MATAIGECLYCKRVYRLRPDGERIRCYQCRRQQLRERQLECQERRKRSWRYRLELAVHWRGMLIGIYPNSIPGHYVARALPQVNRERVPKRRLLDIDVYQTGYTRAQITRFKREIRRLYDLP